VNAGHGNVVRGVLQGGSAGVQLGDTDTVSGTRVSGLTVRDTTGPAIEERSGSDRNLIGDVLSSGTDGIRTAGDATVVHDTVRIEGDTSTQQSDDVTDRETGEYVVPRRTLTVDGDLEEVQSLEPIALGDATDTVPMGGFAADVSLGGDVWFAWDEDRLYLAAAIEDEVHHQPETGGSTWRGDSLQWAISGEPPESAETFAELTIALTPEGPQVHHRTQPSGPSRGLLDVPATIIREGGVTTYEVGIPWSELPASPEGRFATSFLVNENDGQGRTGWAEWTPGIGNSKNPAEFRSVSLDG
jgi:hypothetical protein